MMLSKEEYLNIGKQLKEVLILIREHFPLYETTRVSEWYINLLDAKIPFIKLARYIDDFLSGGTDSLVSVNSIFENGTIDAIPESFASYLETVEGINNGTEADS